MGKSAAQYEEEIRHLELTLQRKEAAIEQMNGQLYVNALIHGENRSLTETVRPLAELSWKLLNSVGLNTRQELNNMLIDFDRIGIISLDDLRKDARFDSVDLSGFTRLPPNMSPTIYKT